MTDPIADMLTRIRNTVILKKTDLVIPFSKLKWQIAAILEREGFVSKAEEVKAAPHQEAQIRITLRYQDGVSTIQGIDRVSRPGRRVYRRSQVIPRVLPSLGIQIVSTSQGLKTNTEAKKQKLGGEVLCTIY